MNLRAKVLINKKFQFAFILKAALPLLLFNLLIAALLFWGVTIIEKDIGYKDSFALGNAIGMKINQFFQNSDQLFHFIYGYGGLILAGFIFITFGYAFFIFLYFSHKIAGPITRFKSILDEILQGNLTLRFNIRKKDQFKEIAEKSNEMIASLQDRIKRMDQFNEFTINAIREMKENAASEELKQNLTRVEDLSMSIHDLIHEFKFK